jgi:hypothetical protein
MRSGLEGPDEGAEGHDEEGPPAHSSLRREQAGRFDKLLGGSIAAV